ncbi:MAG TPA: hypothetical protein V6C65_35185, partial [Allocoleopsis sp.]
AKEAKADFLGHVIVGGVTNQVLTNVTQNDCQNASGVGQDACAVPEAIVGVHQDVSNAVGQTVQHTCQNASGLGEDACTGVEDVSSFKKQISEQVSHIHLFSGSHDSQSPSDSSQPPSSQPPSSQTPSSQTPSSDSPEEMQN